eukprot:493535-Pyramimonas_sp.AAC.1
MRFASRACCSERSPRASSRVRLLVPRLTGTQLLQTGARGEKPAPGLQLKATQRAVTKPWL